MEGCAVWLLTRLQNITGFRSFGWDDIMWAIFGGVFGPAISITILSKWIDYETISTENVEGLEESIEEAGFLVRLILFFMIVVWAPLSEEIVFRGMLWNALEKSWISAMPIAMITSMLFVLAHVDPIHIIGVMPIGFFLGWLRHRSGSTIPTILCHAVNNGVVFAMIIAGV